MYNRKSLRSVKRCIYGHFYIAQSNTVYSKPMCMSQCVTRIYVQNLFLFSSPQIKEPCHSWKEENNNLTPLTQLQSAEKPQGRTWKKSVWPSYQLLKKWCFLKFHTYTYIYIIKKKKSTFTRLYWILYELCQSLQMHTKTNYSALNFFLKKGKLLHLGEEPGLWGMLGPPSDVRMPWQLSVTSLQMTAVLPDPALPTMTAPRPSQLRVFLRTSSRRVKSQSRPTKGVSVVMPGTSNRSGFSMMSACLNGTNRPG